MLNVIYNKILSIRNEKHGVLCIAINGIEGSGKTTLAANLNNYLLEKGLKSKHVSIDGFHNTREIRYQKGRDNFLGYYEDAYDELAFKEHVLLATKHGIPYIVEEIYDMSAEEPVVPNKKFLDKDSVIITDGAYLFKDIYSTYWDFKIYLKVDYIIAVERAIVRDEVLLGGRENTINLYNSRYHKASRYYSEKFLPEKIADTVFDFNNLNDITLLK